MPKLSRPAFLLSALIFVTACDKAPTVQTEAPLRPVRTIVASATESVGGRDFPGIVIAKNKADMSFRVAGKLQEILINEGDQVEKGQIIARLDQTDFKITLDDKQASYNSAKENFARASKLVEPGHISKSDFDKIQANYRTAEAMLKTAEQNLIYTELKAPFNGNVTKKYVDNFEEVAAKEVVATLQDLESMEIEIDVPESLQILIRPNGNRPWSIHAKFEAIKDEKFPLTFSEISTQADEVTGTYKVKLNLPKIDEYSILPGMTATVVAERRSGADVPDIAGEIVIPSHAVLEDNVGRFVFIATPDSATPGTAVIHRREVTSSRLTRNGITVTSGIEPDELVVVAGMSKMLEGMQVKLMERSAPTGVKE